MSPVAMSMTNTPDSTGRLAIVSARMSGAFATRSAHTKAAYSAAEPASQALAEPQPASPAETRP
ncbi:hypothetical protein GCM10020219_044010 [Nonomuraea dietziae]